jgi:phosphoglycolate phosphatase
MSLRAVLFDLDGTLLDTLEDLADSVNAVLRESGFPTHPVEAYRYFVGDGARALMTRALPEANRSEANITRSLRGFVAAYAVRWNIKTHPYPGIDALLEGLDCRGIHKAVLSNKPHDATVRCVEELLKRWEFSVVLGLQEGGPRKPEPDGALLIARRLGVHPGEFLYVGDTPTDMHTATAAGMIPVGALWGYRMESELVASGARMLAASPIDVLGILDAQAEGGVRT